MTNGLQTLKEGQKFFNAPSASILGTINAMYPVGKVFGVFASAFLGDRFGRNMV
jgi:MFS family permease